MKRKRFVKLMMAAGHDRNEANELATKARCGRCYTYFWCILRQR